MKYADGTPPDYGDEKSCIQNIPTPNDFIQGLHSIAGGGGGGTLPIPAR